MSATLRSSDDESRRRLYSEEFVEHSASGRRRKPDPCNIQVDQASVEAHYSAEWMLELRSKGVFHYGPRLLFEGRAKDHLVSEHETLAELLGPSDAGDIDLLIADIRAR